MNPKIKFSNSAVLAVFITLWIYSSGSRALAETVSSPVADEKLFKIVHQLQQEVQDLHQIVEKQNETIEVLKRNVEDVKGQGLDIAHPKPAEEKKEKTLRENLRRYLLEKPDSLPKEDEMQPVKAGMGDIKMGLLIQEWYSVDDHAKDNFRTRRLELAFKGKLIDHLGWEVNIDPTEAREDNTTRSILKDAFLEFDGLPHHTIKLGQYKVPVTEEGYRSSSVIDTIERSFITRTFGDKRDIGLMALGKWKYLNYQIGVFNGDERNRLDTNDQKDVVARFVLSPFRDHSLLEKLELGSSLYWRATHDSASEKKRVGLEARYELGPLSLKSEYMKAQDAGAPADGWYAQMGYFFLPRWQAIFKFEGFDPNERSSENKEFDTTLGLNYFFVYPKTKLQINYVHKDAQENGTTDNQLVTALQYAF